MTPATDNRKNGKISYKMLTGWLVAIVVALVSAGYNYTTTSNAAQLGKISDQQEAIQEAVGELKITVAVLEQRLSTVAGMHLEIKEDVQEIKRKLN